MNDPYPSADPSRYDQAAKTYNFGRLMYDPSILRHAMTMSKLGPDSTALDLGCGPGTIANQIAPHCRHVLAVDTSAAMLEAGRAEAPANVTYRQGSAEDLSFIDTPLQLVTFGRSFHWMNREATLAALEPLVAPDGCVALLYVAPMPAGKGFAEFTEHFWWREILRAADAMSDSNTKELQRPDLGKEREEVILMRSAFCDLSFIGHVERFEWSFERLVAWVQSRYVTSGSEGSVEREAIEDMLRSVLEPYGPGPWVTWNQHRVVVARRPT